ncbi:MAG: tRNA (adenosine(37)-N6)-threonylcarbamoyltransferase complex dimerization subunit type 1 TsaB [Gammaproteobacteria bacterium]|nr:tRNA (adenosine(37)-N6)-threonylcarbamoyltransferase complex dimerization subunit type 1 TsaB [Gammaproteobacteria bacterium]
MKLLALETSTEVCSVAISLDGKIHERIDHGQHHSDVILGMVQQVLAEAGLSLKQLDAIAFSRGPGSFTSLRIGAGVVQGLAFGANLPVVPVSSLAVLAQGVDAPKVLAAFDARMNQVYWGAYVRDDKDLMRLTGAEIVIAPADAPLPEGSGWVGAGSGWDQYAAALTVSLSSYVAECHKQVFPRARHVAELGMELFKSGQTVTAEQALPVYVRDNVAAKIRLG